MYSNHRADRAGAGPLAFVTAAVVMMTLAGCATGATPEGAATQERSAEAQAALDKAYAGLGGDLELPPADVADDVSLYVISCGESNSGCAEGTAGLVEGGKAAGWDVEVADGKLSPEGFATAIRQAIAAGADVIIPMGFGCMAAQAAFKEARDAGITIVGGGGPDDCDPALWDAVPQWLEGTSFDEKWALYGQLGADWAYGITEDAPRAITLTHTTNGFGPLITDGFVTEFEKLGGKVVANVDVTDPEAASGSFIQKVTTALLANPDVNVLQIPGGGFLTGGLYQAIAQSGVEDLTIVVGGPSDTTTLDLIRSGSNAGITLGAVGEATRWAQWASVDTAIRVLADQSPAYSAQPMVVVDADNNLPASGPFDGGDWESAYLASWGKG